MVGDIQRAKNNARFMKIWKRIIKLVQDRLGSFKGITVFFNYENIKITLTQELADMLNERNIEQFTAGQEICLGDYDLLVPDSVRKYTAGEFEDYPFEVCNYLKRKKEWVNLNQQFINALKIKPDAYSLSSNTGSTTERVFIDDAVLLYPQYCVR